MNEIKKKLKKEFGDVFLSPQFIIDKKRTVLSVSPKLDIALNGGIPSGSWGIISGKSKLGKSTLALHLCAEAQKKENGSRMCYYFDIEHRLENKNLTGIPGLQFGEDQLEIITSTKNNILTAEKTLTIAEALLKSEEGIILVLDSSSALCTEKEYGAEMSATGRNEGPKLLAQFTRKLANIVPVQDSIVIIIQHMIANTSGYGPAFMEDGGNKIIYQSDWKLRGTAFAKWTEGAKGEESGKQIGQVNTWEVVYSALGQPNGKIESYLRFGSGIDKTWELIELACDLNIIEKGGAWFTLSFLPDKTKVQGQKKVWDYLNSNPKERKILEKLVKEAFLL